MKRIRKNVLSIITALIIVMGMFSQVPIGISNVYAAETNATEKQAKDWMDKIVREGATIKNGGTQCVAVFNEYLGAVFGIDWHTNYGSVWNAYEIFDKNPPSGFTKIAGAGNYRAGDIIVFKPNVTYNGYVITKGTGHVAIIYSVNGNTVNLVHQNFAGNSVPFNKAMSDGLKSAVKGVIRPTWKTEGCTPHNYTNESAVVEKAPTTTSKGLWRFKCANCGDTGLTREIPALGDANLKNGTYMIQSALDANKYVSVTPFQSYKQGNISLYSKDVADQKFHITKNADGTYKFGYGKLVVDVCGGAPVGNVWLWDDTGDNAQKWYVVPMGDGYCRVVNRAQYFNFDVVNFGTANGTNIGSYWDNGGKAQRFKFVLVECDQHNWDAGKVTKQETATEDGEITYTCKDCHMTKKETTKKKHVHDYKVVSRIAPTVQRMAQLQLNVPDVETQ